MCHYEGIIRSLLLSMLVVGTIVLLVAGVILYSDQQEKMAFEAYQAVIEETSK